MWFTTATAQSNPHCLLALHSGKPSRYFLKRALRVRSTLSIQPTAIDLTFDAGDEIYSPTDIIRTEDGQFLLIANVSDSNGNAKGIRFIKLDF